MSFGYMSTEYSVLSRYYDLLFPRDYLSEVKFILKHTKSKKLNILDVGCGTGWHAFHLTKLGHRVTCIDSNKEMLELAKVNSPKAVFKKGNMKEIRVNKSYDVVLLMFGTINYCKDVKDLEKLYRESFAEFAKILPENGRIVICVPAYRKNRNDYIMFPSLDFAASLGYNQLSLIPAALAKKLKFLKLTPRGTAIYDRKDQIVAREIAIFEKA
jgi:SAM-dependent methyltransferase